MMNDKFATDVGMPQMLMSVADAGEGFPPHSAAVVIDSRGFGDDGRSSISNPDAALSASSDTTGICCFKGADAGRSKADDWRVALHEGGHVVVGRALGSEVGGVTIIEGPDYGGKTWGPAGNASRVSSVDEQPELAEKIAGLMPAFGEPRSGAADIFAHVHVRITDLMAGTAAETLLHLDCAPWVALSDIRQARSLAGIICTSEAAIDAYLAFAAEEAKALITTHRAAVLAIAEALMVHRTLELDADRRHHRDRDGA